MKTKSLYRALALFSIGLGLIELLAPQRINRALGVSDSSLLVRGYGLREIAAGVGLLNPNTQIGAMKARVAGDALDVGTLIRAASTSKRPRAVIAALAAVAAVTLVDVLATRSA